MRPKLAVTITDVAEKADVSIATVSRIINGKGPFREETEQRVREAIRDTGYQPKPRGKTDTGSESVSGKFSGAPLAFLRIGTFESAVQSPVTRHLEQALMKAAASKGHPIASYEVTDMGAVSIKDVVGNAQGVVIRTSSLVDINREASEWLAGLPAVSVLGKSWIGRHWMDHLGPDNEQAGALAAEYLLQQGCDRLVFATTNNRTRGVSLARCASFAKLAAAKGTPCRVYFQASPTDIEAVRNALSHLPAETRVIEKRNDLIRQIVEDHPERFGLFAPTDLELSVIMPQLEMLGVDFHDRCVPIGCDNETRCFSALETLPATLDLQIDDLAERAIRRLRFRMEHPDESIVRMMISPKLVPPANLSL
jgi:DNA-binding LacI/PurR family transcriptional regulator